MRSFRGADFGTDQYLVVVKVTERFVICKQAAQKLDGERFNLGKVKELSLGNNIRLRLQTVYSFVELK